MRGGRLKGMRGFYTCPIPPGTPRPLAGKARRLTPPEDQDITAAYVASVVTASARNRAVRTATGDILDVPRNPVPWLESRGQALQGCRISVSCLLALRVYLLEGIGSPGQQVGRIL